MKHLALAASLLIVLAASWAGAAPMAARAVHVEGDAKVFAAASPKAGKTITVGWMFMKGDKIFTGADGAVEIEMDTGDLVKLDNNSAFSITQLDRDSGGSTNSIFDLAVGRVVSAVEKLASRNSRFEIRTKTAICGVAGTPPWVVQFQPGQQRTLVDLLGRPGEPGVVYVRGFDPSQTLITIFAGQRTLVNVNQPPMPPAPISHARLRQLRNAIPIITRPGLVEQHTEPPAGPSGEPAPPGEPEDEENGEPEEQPAGEEPGGEQNGDDQAGEPGEPEGEPLAQSDGAGEPEDQAPPEPDHPPEPPADMPPPPPPPMVDPFLEQLVFDMLKNTVSVPELPDPNNSGEMEGLNTQTNSNQGAIGQDADSSGQSAPPPQAATFRININFR